jgi:VWFA-related protein
MHPRWFRQCSALTSLTTLLMSTVLPLQAQQAASQEPPSVTIRVNTRLVLVDVVVTDKAGKPSSGLKAEDFSVQEKGKTQKIAFLSPPQEAPRNSPPELAPGIYTNRPEFRSPGGPLTVLLIDAVNTPFRDQAYARQQMLKYVREQLKPGERMGVFALTNSLRVLQDFTADPQVLLAALEKYKPSEPLTMGGGGAPAVSAAAGSSDFKPGAQLMVLNAQNEINSLMNAQVGYQLDRRVEVTLAGLRSMARILAGIPGRKNVVWLTAGFPFELIPEDRNVSEAELLSDIPTVRQKSVGTLSAGSVAATQRQSYSEDICRVAAELSSAQVAIYPVDARGLMSGMEFLSEDAASGQTDVATRGIARMSDAAANQETMREIAAETGGKAYVNQNEIRFGAAIAAADNAASYTIGYYPEDKKWDGKYRSIKVKVNRDGVDVRSRKGYFAIDPAQLKDRKPEQEVAEALRDSAPDTQVTFSAQVKPGDKGKVNVTYLVDPNTVSAEDASGGKKVNIILYAAVYSPEGKMIENRSLKVDHTFDAATFQKVLQQGILVPMELDAQPGKNDLRLAVQDVRTGLVGTINASMP